MQRKNVSMYFYYFVVIIIIIIVINIIINIVINRRIPALSRITLDIWRLLTVA